jgi:hypothetical protein
VALDRRGRRDLVLQQDQALKRGRAPTPQVV